MKVVLTGSSSGIGAALADRLLRRGHSVWGLARTAGAAAPASPSVPAASKPPTLQSNGRSDPFAANLASKQRRDTAIDVSSWDQVQAAAAEVGRSWGTVDALVTCAAIQGEIGPTLRADPAGWARTVEVDLMGTFYAVRAFAALLRPGEGRRAKVVCFSGGGATKPRPHFSAYGAAKTAVVRLVETIAAEERESPLDINAVAPGAINTRLTDEVIAKGPEAAGAAEHAAALKQKASGGGSLERALDLVEWLLSPASDRITGRLLSAPWDPWDDLQALRPRLELPDDDLYTLRRNTR
ncbi:MAG TPA: SDR family oxidoreductase [Opitutaceae bacterium]|jgi:NAD(P)-dependent dehydrogenase (short-subunit alcohol dehydrogenase family)|nr:SDR family oxidoreductase [Opitutaceae bacterium]